MILVWFINISSTIIDTQSTHLLRQLGPQPAVEVDWLRQQNTSRHHTNEYENVALVLRRGETFNVGLTFKDIISFSEIPKTVFKLRIGMSIVNCALRVEL